MSPKQQIQWRGPPAPRAKPIPQEMWEEYKEELCKLYQKMTLDDLIDLMKVRHSFTPSRRQYISQFEKWQAHKYNIPTKNLTTSLSSDPPKEIYTTDSQENDRCSSNPEEFRTTFSKRPPSLGGRLRIPPKKRQKLCGFMSSEESYRGLELARDKLEDFQSSYQDPLSSRQKKDNIISKDPSSTIQGFDTAVYNSDLLAHGSGQIMTSMTNNEQTLSLGAEGSSASEINGIDKLVEVQTPTDSLSRGMRALDSSHSIHTSSTDEMKLAADFLSSLGLNKDSFPLYTLILGRLKESSDKPAWVTSSAMVSCIMTAVTTPHLEIARTLLQQKLNEPQTTHLEVLSFLILLTHADHRASEASIAKSQIKEVIKSIASYEFYHRDLLKEGCWLDLLMYHSMIRLLQNSGELGRLPQRSPSSNEILDHAYDRLIRPVPGTSSLEQDTADVKCKRIAIHEHLLPHKPGSFEFKKSSFRKSCIGYCLQWCRHELEHENMDFYFRESPKSPQVNDGWCCRWGCIRVYCYLWKRWQSLRMKHTSADLDLWTTQAEPQMGISAARLLFTICEMIMAAGPPTFYNSDRELIQSVRIRTNELSQLSGKSLASHFLVKFSDRMTDWMVFLPTSYEKIMFDDAVHSYVRDFIGESLTVTLPEPPKTRAVDSTVESVIYPGNTQNTPLGQSLNIVAATLLPTLASSLHSSDFSSFRMLRDRIQQDMQSTKQGATFSTPSSVFRGSSRRSFGLPSVGGLSETMASSLSLS